ncbi:glycosyltransferase family 4 protein [Hydrogenophaga aromaticivorans]|uniref:glycosyltransferase family 4 protein n=1 Tax=Hydrogenophaga aromaticivorans TaxID=2610898 RepID=UPI001B369D9C|nr:glycosyltransferase family 4 protein [Hydrogenophaga aromaticivorans]MBQ0921633.1 glycosyltransferase family 4 protein [Hydrogenophaga aromaticivorans]
MIIRVVGQNGGGSRVYVHQLNNALSEQGKQVTTFFKEFKPGDPLTSVSSANCINHYSINLIRILFLILKHRDKIEYIHSHLRNATIICHAICQLFGLNHIITVHGPISYGRQSIKDKIIIKLFGISLEKSIASLFISEFTLQKTLEICKIERRSHFKVIHNGSDEARYNTPPKDACNIFRVVIVGELTDRKRPLEAIKLCTLLNEDEETKGKFHIDIYGDGHLKFQLSNQIRSLHLEESIRLHGNVYNIDEIYSGAGIHLIFAYDEGFGRVVTESMAYGVPTMAFESGAFPEIIEHGKSGFLFSDTEDCVRQLKSIILQKTALPATEKLLRIFSEKFSSAVFKEKTIKAINESLI